MSTDSSLSPMAVSTEEEASAATTGPLAGSQEKTRRKSGPFSFRNIGAIYVWVALVIIFSIWAPNTFPTWATVQQILSENAMTGLVALSIVIPLAAGVFDLSIGYALGLCNVLCAWLIVHAHIAVGPAILMTFLAALIIGLVNALIVVVAKIDSFIATLATGSLLLAGITVISGQEQIVSPALSTGFFYDIANTSLGGISISALYMLIAAAVIWWILERTVAGRWIYATGFSQDAARLAGVPTRTLRFVALLVSAGLAGGITGIAVTSQIGAGDTTVGPPYLLSAFAAAFLGATQLRRGRFNAWGTVIAILLLGTGQTGLSLATTAPWAPSVFTGVVLIIALAVTRAER